MHDGATDPVLVQHTDGTWWSLYTRWWSLYTRRRATAPGPGVAWVHGSDIGVAVSETAARRSSTAARSMDIPAQQRSSVQVARLRVADGHLRCDRDEDVKLRLPTEPPAR